MNLFTSHNRSPAATRVIKTVVSGISISPIVFFVSATFSQRPGDGKQLVDVLTISFVKVDRHLEHLLTAAGNTADAYPHTAVAVRYPSAKHLA